MATLIDSSVLIAAERGRLDLKARLSESPTEEFKIAAITAAELLHGLHRAATAPQRANRELVVEHLLATLPTLPYDLVVARVHARVWAELAARGVNVGAHDLIIAATAVANGCAVATRDVRSFPKIPGLSVVCW